jgi:hypothetical protein
MQDSYVMLAWDRVYITTLFSFEYQTIAETFPVTAERLAYQAGPSRRVNQLKPAPGIR